MNRLKTVRLKLKWSQERMAKELGMSARRIQGLESEESLRKIIHLALDTILLRHSLLEKVP
jgi:transcriptional regulator with XRE-family HTH domain